MGLMGRRNSLSSLVNLQRFRHSQHSNTQQEQGKPLQEEAKVDDDEITNPVVRIDSSSSLEDDESSFSIDIMSLNNKMMRRHSTGCGPKTVRFGDCKIRSYPQVLGDHPCCSMGCPVELGWDYGKEEVQKVNDFEEQRDHQRRRSRGELLLSPEERRSILSLTTDDQGAIRKACRRQCTRKAQRKIQREFFSS